MTLSSYFDPYKTHHLEAYAIYKKKGFWPEDFIPVGVQEENNCLSLIESKLSQAWLRHALSGRIDSLI